MNIVIVGGTGLIGGHAALLLKELGHHVSLMARKPSEAPALKELPFIAADYVEDDLSDGRLVGFDALVFAAAADLRNLPRDGSVTEDAFYSRANTEAVPAFFRVARDAGIQSAVYIGSFYPQVVPERIDICPYVRSRHLTDTAVRELSTDTFRVCSLNAPFVLGHLPGLAIPHLDAMVAYVRGQLEGLPLFAPLGGTNHIAVSSLAEAIVGALERGEPGHAYLVGDENYSWKSYLETWCAAVGNPCELEVRSDDHPMLPNVIMFAGPGATVNYEPDPIETERLGYRRNQIQDTIESIVAASS